MVKEQEMVSLENLKRPIGFRHFGISSLCEGESQTSKVAFNGSIYSANIHIRLYLYDQADGACSEPTFFGSKKQPSRNSRHPCRMSIKSYSAVEICEYGCAT